MNRKIGGILCAIILLSSCEQSNSDITTSTDGDYIRSTGEDYKKDFILAAAKLVKDSDTPGVAVAIVRGDGQIWMHGFGYADLAKKTPMTADTVISIGSVSKTITGVAAMQTVEKGMLTLDTDINEYLSFPVINPKNPEGKITMRHVLTHTTGIIDNGAVYNSPVVYYPGGDNPLALGDFLKEYLTPEGKYYSRSGNFTKTAPGERYQYSNIVFGLAGHLVESAASQPFNEFTRDNIFEPLEMYSTGWKYTEVDEASLGRQYGNKDDAPAETMTGPAIGQWRAYKKYSLATYPDGGLRTSVSDLSHFLIAMMNRGVYKGTRILKEETFEAMLTPQRFGHERIPNIRGIKDLAIAFVYEVPASIGEVWGRIGHMGGDPGTVTFMYYDPETKLGIIYFTNSDIDTDEQIYTIQTIIRSMVANADRFFEE